ncbi:hypothetical protein EXW96_18260 [Paenibacillus sp. JMULE4]|uniref:Uncharacterized protein n=1 Tax=Paenibacillus validus TaxID=44253 RepID=A0A7X2ZGT0_9BACL|nr:MULTISPECIES: hypothetical protein [Paenibacillus]MUG73988.1 hypothetical protein [Paenibacillus validus]NTZ19440.1 hypothetical protein [Paenibacillus sp. JMULE4]
MIHSKIIRIAKVVLEDTQGEMFWFNYEGLYMLTDKQYVKLRDKEVTYLFLIINNQDHQLLRAVYEEDVIVELKERHPLHLNKISLFPKEDSVYKMTAYYYDLIKSDERFQTSFRIAADDKPLDVMFHFLKTGYDNVHFLEEN